MSNVRITQDADADGCVNASERGVEGDDPDVITATVDFDTSDLPNDTAFEVRQLDGVVLGAGSILNNHGLVNISLGQGTRRFYIAAADPVENRLPTPEDDGFSANQIAVDAIVPNLFREFNQRALFGRSR